MKKVYAILLLATVCASSYGIYDQCEDVPMAFEHCLEDTAAYIVQFTPPEEKVFYRKLYTKKGMIPKKPIMVCVGHDESTDFYQLGTIVALATAETKQCYLGERAEK